MDFYKRNYIEGLFLSSAVHINPNYTMERLLLVVKKLRLEYNFHGYIHLKGIPRADERLINEAGKFVDRMSFNLELPSEQSLKLLAPQKNKQALLLPMKNLQSARVEFLEDKRKGLCKNQLFVPAGQTTQVIIGASPESDGHILGLTQSLYQKMQLKRVYYSSYVPVVQDSLLPTTGAGQLREHRLYQADWLLRFYGFSVEELLSEKENLATEVDPKCDWALKHISLFPVEINKAPLETLLRVPGIGVRNAQKILSARRYTKLTFEDLIKMRIAMKRAKHFITCSGKFYGEKNPLLLRGILSETEAVENAQQLSLFENFQQLSTPENRTLALHGEF